MMSHSLFRAAGNSLGLRTVFVYTRCSCIIPWLRSLRLLVRTRSPYHSFRRHHHPSLSLSSFCSSVRSVVTLDCAIAIISHLPKSASTSFGCLDRLTTDDHEASRFISNNNAPMSIRAKFIMHTQYRYGRAGLPVLHTTSFLRTPRVTSRVRCCT